MDVWYPTRERNSSKHPDPIIWSLRTLVNLPKVRRVYITGALPPGIDVESVWFIPIPQDQGKFVNIGNNLLAVLDSDISETFLAMNDDQFILEPWTPTMNTRERMMDDFVDSLTEMGAIDHDAYVRGMRSQRDIMRAWGYDTSTIRCPDHHWPMPVSKKRLRRILARVAVEYPEHELGHFKGVYGAGLKLNPTRDCKIQTPNQVLDLPVVSTSASSWLGRTGRMIRTTYTEPSPYET